MWENTEPYEALLHSLPVAWRNGLPNNPERAQATLSARLALISLYDKAKDFRLVKDDYGKPFFELEHPVFLSLSHTDLYAAAMVSDLPCGIDVQKQMKKIIKLRSKFESKKEFENTETQSDHIRSLHILWGAKEALFKLWGKRNLDWKKNLIVDSFDSNQQKGVFFGRIAKDNEIIQAHLWFEWIDDLCLVCAEQIPLSNTNL